MRVAADAAKAFAQNYVSITDALRREGVPEEVAREEARHAALVTMHMVMGMGARTWDPALGPCPTCGNG